MSPQDATSVYSFDFPKELIATQGIEPRENARLLVYDRETKKVELGHFFDLPTYLGPETVLVFNETKVVPARLEAKTIHGGAFEMTVIKIFDGEVRTLSSRPLEIGAEAYVGDVTFRMSRTIDKFSCYKTGMDALEMRAFLDQYGRAPLPPYIKNSPLSKEEAQRQYQTVFAKNDGSIAAPTASLHFSEKLLDALREKGVGIEFITLHVGLGTFLPVTETQLASGTLHEEEYWIEPEVAARLNEACKAGKRIIPVGTTSLRTLESAANAAGQLVNLSGTTNLFIRPGYEFKVAGGLITNFHVPQSSLLMLVDTFLGGNDEWRKIYEHAIAEQFRLFSFGDGMLLL